MLLHLDIHIYIHTSKKREISLPGVSLVLAIRRDGEGIS